jgi:hypothetical protein
MCIPPVLWLPLLFKEFVSQKSGAFRQPRPEQGRSALMAVCYEMTLNLAALGPW